MRSTLPQIYKSQRRSRSNSAQKQGGIFSIYLNTQQDLYSIPESNLKGTMLANRYDKGNSKLISKAHNRSISYDISKSNPIKKIQEIDSILTLFNVCSKQTEQTAFKISSLDKQNKQIKKQYHQLSQKYHKYIQQTHNYYSKQIGILKQKLSKNQKEIGMEIKTNKRDINNINQQLIAICEIMQQLQQSRQKCQQKI